MIQKRANGSFFVTSYLLLLKYLEMRGGKPDNPRAKQGHPVYKPE